MKKSTLLQKIASTVLIFLGLGVATAFAQKFTISGSIKDAKNGEDIIGATVYVKETQSGVATNQYGFYSITLPKGEYTLVFTYIGYKTETKKVKLNDNVKMNLNLSEESIAMEEVVISEKRPDANVTEMKMSKVELNMVQLKKLPPLFGEPDLIKLVQLQPGVVSAGEGTGSFYVRGGSADQNLILYDEAPVYDPTHIFGLIGAFNTTIVKTVDLYKGGIPAQYGGRLSSVLDIKSIDGNTKRTTAELSLGTLALRANVQGPIFLKRRPIDSLTKKKITPDEGAPISYLLSFRRSFVGYFLRLNPDPAGRNNDIYFMDFNGKINYNIDPKNRVFVSSYSGRDYLQVGNNFTFDWGNTTGTLRWNHIFNDKLFSNTTFIASNFDYSLGVTNIFRWTSYIREFTLKEDMEYFISPRSNIKFGLSAAFRQFSPGQFKGLDPRVPDLNLQKLNAMDNALYISHYYELTKRFSVDYGLRLSIFANFGPGKFYNYSNPTSNQNIQRLDTVNYSDGAVVRSAINPEPRIGFKYMVDANSSVKASYNRMVQNVHQIYTGIVPLPTSFWLPTTYYLKPQLADQWALGYFRNFKDNMFEASAEVYYKNMQNAVDFIDNSQVFFNEDLPIFLKQGRGWSYGAEIFIKKTRGKLQGQLGYTYSRTFRNIPYVNNGNDYVSGFDRPNSLNILLSYDFTPRISVAAVFTYTTGRPITLPVGVYFNENTLANLYTERNGFRLPDYHRLDVSVVFKSKQKANRNWSSETNIGIYNVYNRKNPFTVAVQPATTDKTNADGTIMPGDPINPPNRREAVLIYLYPILPSISYTISFNGVKPRAPRFELLNNDNNNNGQNR